MEKKPFWKRWWFWLIIIVLLIAIGSFGDDSSVPTSSDSANQTATKTSQPSEPKKADLEIVEHHPESDQFTRYIVGTVKNNTNKEYGYVQVEINLYDDDGTQVGSTMDNTNNLEPEGTWKFKAMMLEDSATKYKIKDVSGF